MSRALAKADTALPEPARPPRLPEAISRAIADPFALDGDPLPDWQMPAVLPAENELARALQLLESSLQPTSGEFLIARLKRLGVATRHQGNADTWRDRLTEYGRHLSRYPADIVGTVVDQMQRTQEWFPALATLDKAMGLEVTRRKREIDRLKAMLAARKEPEQPKAPLLRDMERAERLRLMLATYRKIYGDGHPRSVRAEIDLAEAEGRAVEPWAT